mmetsp:Transcript_16360/g.34511  ORF Transcript_16360/g.34511 Transcript_16360/m.34511 type:complete len:87 (-) Transcript_16360:901-1161(-)
MRNYSTTDNQLSLTVLPAQPHRCAVPFMIASDPNARGKFDNSDRRNVTICNFIYSKRIIFDHSHNFQSTNIAERMGILQSSLKHNG